MTEVLLVLLALLAVLAVVILVLRRRNLAKRPTPRRVHPLADEPDVYDPHAIGVGDAHRQRGVQHRQEAVVVGERGDRGDRDEHDQQLALEVRVVGRPRRRSRAWPAAARCTAARRPHPRCRTLPMPR